MRDISYEMEIFLLLLMRYREKTQLLIYNEYSKKRKATSLLYWEYGVVFVAFLCHNDGIIIT